MKTNLVTRAILPLVCAASLGLFWVGTAVASTPPARAGAVRLTTHSLFHVRGHVVTVSKRTTVLQGRVTPYVAGQRVSVELSLGGRIWRTVKLPVRRGTASAYGTFRIRYRARRPGHMAVAVFHEANSKQAAFHAHLYYWVLNPRARPGAHGWFVQLVQSRLAHLHFFLWQSGVYDFHTELAIDAYHRLLHRGTSMLLDSRTLRDLLDGRGAFHVRFPRQGRHAEGDLSNQILALINGSKVQMLFPISSGKPSTPTILGSYRVYMRVPGYLPDGMYYSDFFTGGYAIHGYDPAPDYPASHGCMRLPIVDAITAYNWLAIGDWVDTYYR